MTASKRPTQGAKEVRRVPPTSADLITALQRLPECNRASFAKKSEAPRANLFDAKHIDPAKAIAYPVASGRIDLDSFVRELKLTDEKARFNHIQTRLPTLNPFDPHYGDFVQMLKLLPTSTERAAVMKQFPDVIFPMLRCCYLINNEGYSERFIQEIKNLITPADSIAVASHFLGYLESKKQRGELVGCGSDQIDQYLKFLKIIPESTHFDFMLSVQSLIYESNLYETIKYFLPLLPKNLWIDFLRCSQFTYNECDLGFLLQILPTLSRDERRTIILPYLHTLNIQDAAFFISRFGVIKLLSVNERDAILGSMHDCIRQNFIQQLAANMPDCNILFACMGELAKCVRGIEEIEQHFTAIIRDLPEDAKRIALQVFNRHRPNYCRQIDPESEDVRLIYSEDRASVATTNFGAQLSQAQMLARQREAMSPGPHSSSVSTSSDVGAKAVDYKLPR